MTHLTAFAEEYIFERMCNTYCSEKTIADMKQVEKFMKTENHRIIDVGTARTAETAKQQIANKRNRSLHFCRDLVLKDAEPTD